MKIEKPIIIIGAPRSGTTLLYSIFSSHPQIWSLYQESGRIIEEDFHPTKFEWKRGNSLGAIDASKEVVDKIKYVYFKKALNYQLFRSNDFSKVYTNIFLERIRRIINKILIAPLKKPDAIRIVDKLPRNCLRVNFMNAIFPDAYFIYLVRDPRSNISSLIEGWNVPERFETYRLPCELDIEGYSGNTWNFVLPPGWEEYARGKTLAEVCAFQYRVSNSLAFADISGLPKNRWIMIAYEDLVADPRKIIRDICDKVELDYVGGLKKMAELMPPVNTNDMPNKDKWKKNEIQVMSVIESVREISELIGYRL